VIPTRTPDDTMKDDATIRFVASAAAAGWSEVATLPIDVTKVRLQMSLAAAPPSGQMGVAWGIVANEGASALWKGLVPALIRQCSYTGLSLVLYEPIRDTLAPGVAKHDMPFWKRVVAGGTAGGASIFVMNWTDVIKTRMQSSAEPLSFGPTFRQVWNQHGLRGLWAGSIPNVARCFVGNAAELGCYDQFKTMLVVSPYAVFTDDATASHLAASTGAGFVSSLVSAPVDVMKTRIQSGLEEQSLVKVALNIVRREGFLAFYKGFWPLFQRKVVWTVIFFTAYEKFRAGLSTVGRLST